MHSISSPFGERNTKCFFSITFIFECLFFNLRFFDRFVFDYAVANVRLFASERVRICECLRMKRNCK